MGLGGCNFPPLFQCEPRGLGDFLFGTERSDFLVEFEAKDLGRAAARNIARGVTENQTVLVAALGQPHTVDLNLQTFQSPPQGFTVLGLQKIQRRKEKSVLVQQFAVAGHPGLSLPKQVPLDQTVRPAQFKPRIPGRIGDQNAARHCGTFSDLNPKFEPEGLTPLGGQVRRRHGFGDALRRRHSGGGWRKARPDADHHHYPALYPAHYHIPCHIPPRRPSHTTRPANFVGPEYTARPPSSASMRSN